MIVAEQKGIEEIIDMIGDNFKKLLIVGCGTCVTVSMAGGVREVEALAELLESYYKSKNMEITIKTATLKRQCDFEFVDQLEAEMEKNDLVLSLGCGVGVQHLVERYNDKIILPGLNTSFYGATVDTGEWSERCMGCGDCVLDQYFGICPLTRCSKGLLNGPCGGSQDGKCEVDDEIDCAWELIYNRAKELDRVDELLDYEPPKDWQTYRDGGPRTLINQEYHGG